jgi:hypothetical protein
LRLAHQATASDSVKCNRQPSELEKISPTVVPTSHLSKVLGTSRLTTLVKPLCVPVQLDGSLSDHEKYYDYAVDLDRSLDSLDDMLKHFIRMKAFLRFSELGWAEHGRSDDGRLCWDLTESGRENEKNGMLEEFFLADLGGKLIQQIRGLQSITANIRERAD